jgi:YVTN family beta-propeller protein
MFRIAVLCEGFPSATNPEGIETSADHNSVYLVNRFSNEVRAINTETLAVTAKMPVGDSPGAFGTFLREAL